MHSVTCGEQRIEGSLVLLTPNASKKRFDLKDNRTFSGFVVSAEIMLLAAQKRLHLYF